MVDSMIIYDAFISAFVMYSGVAVMGVLAGLIWVLIKERKKNVNK